MEKIKKYTIKYKIGKEQNTIERINDGFSAAELLGLLEMTQLEILEQMRGIIKPDIIKRKVINRKQYKNNNSR